MEKKADRMGVEGEEEMGEVEGEEMVVRYKAGKVKQRWKGEMVEGEVKEKDGRDGR